MARPIPGQNYPRWHNPILDQEYPRWNNLFDTMDFDDVDSLRRILQTARTAEKFHPFNLKLIEGATLSDAEMIAVRDLSYAFNRNHLCRDMVRHIILFSRHDDQDFPLGREAKFYTEILKTVELSPVHEPKTYLQVRREFRRLAPDLEDLNENRAAEELNRWARWGVCRMSERIEIEIETTKATQKQDDGLVHGQGTNINVKDGKEVIQGGDKEEADVIKAAKILVSMGTQRNVHGSVVTSVLIPQESISNKGKGEEPGDEQNNQ
ncbi:hypothetical protein NHQ30_007870 [Ciborinia camelliae]|nr:hypothetical protein NHQ30_007870 [Ciborinia camelliae]